MSDVRREITAQELLEGLSQAMPQDVEFSRCNFLIRGELDLKHRIIQVAVSLTNCIFTHEVDLSHSEFMQCVDFSGSCFKDNFESAGAVYHKSLNFERAIFEESATFEGIQCTGEGRFTGSRFENTDTEITFAGAEFNELVCGEFLFLLPLEFQTDPDNEDILSALRHESESNRFSLSCDIEARFEEAYGWWAITDSDNTRICTVMREGDRFSVYRCCGTFFRGGASFNSLFCKMGGHFQGARFEGERYIDFIGARFGFVDYTGAIFKSGANFSGMQCASYGFFRDVRFENRLNHIDFTGARFGELNCERTFFDGGAIFNALQCERVGSFRKAIFGSEEHKANFAAAHFGVLDCSGAIFKSGVDFSNLQCERDGLFKNTQFQNTDEKIDFTFARFGRALEFQGMNDGKTVFAGEVDFQHIQVPGSLVLWNARFQKTVSFYSAVLGEFSLMNSSDGNYGCDSLPFKGSGVDLRMFVFRNFEGTKEQQQHVVEIQVPEKFSREPYLQFERHYRSIGDEKYSRDLYYSGRLAERKNMRNWSLWKKASDWFLCWTVGYGVKTWRLLILLSIFLSLGALLFSPGNVLIPEKSDAKMNEASSVLEQTGQTSNTDQSVDRYRFFREMGHRIWYSIKKTDISSLETSVVEQNREAKVPKQSAKRHGMRLLERFSYSLDLLLPIVNLGVAKEYQRPQGWPGYYSVIHIIVGWILVPLFLASISGIVKR